MQVFSAPTPTPTPLFMPRQKCPQQWINTTLTHTLVLTPSLGMQISLSVLSALHRSSFHLYLHCGLHFVSRHLTLTSRPFLISSLPLTASQLSSAQCGEMAHLLLSGAISNALCPQRCHMLNDPELGRWGVVAGKQWPWCRQPLLCPPPNLSPSVSKHQRQANTIVKAEGRVGEVGWYPLQRPGVSVYLPQVIQDESPNKDEYVLLMVGEKQTPKKYSPHSPAFLAWWLSEHERNLPGSAQVGSDLPLLVPV